MKNYIEKTSIKYGILTAAGLIAFFFVMKLLGLVGNYELRVLNVFLLFGGVYLAVKQYRSGDSATYLGGIGTGLFTSAIALALFAAFIMIYLGAIDPEFMSNLKEYEYFGRYLNPYIAGAVIFLEGSMSGLLLTFILMQYYKKSHISSPEPSIP